MSEEVFDLTNGQNTIPDVQILHSSRDLQPLDEELLMILAEECAEIIQECIKAYRFDINTPNPHNGTTPLQRLHLEMGDVLGVMRMLVKRGIFDQDKILEYAKLKEQKVFRNLRNTWEEKE